MGKTQKKRAMRRHNPIRVPDSHLSKGLAAASVSSSKAEAILPVMQKLDSPDVAERQWACVAIVNLIQNDPSTRRLLQAKNVVGALVGRLADAEEEVVLEAAGALRNLCIDGGHDVCAEMYNKNILIPLKIFLPKLSDALSQCVSSQPPHAVPELARKQVRELAVSVITILWCLSETSHKALSAINQMSLIPFLMPFLASPGRVPLGTVTAAAQCLYVLTDDNPPAINDLKSKGAYIDCLLSIIRNERLLTEDWHQKGEVLDDRPLTLRILAAGILRNVAPIPPLSMGDAVDLDADIVLPLLQPILSSVSLPEVSKRTQELVIKAACDPLVDRLSSLKLMDDHKTEIELELERLEGKLRDIRLALEILTGMSATLPDPDESAAHDEDSDGSDDDEGREESMDLSDKPSLDDDTSNKRRCLPDLVQHLLPLVHPTPLSFPPPARLSPHPPMTSALGSIHIAALDALNNVFLSLAVGSAEAIRAAEVGGGMLVWRQVWAALSAVGTETGLGQENRRDMWGAAVGVLWSVCNIWKRNIVPSEGQVELLTQFCDSTRDDQVRVKCIGVLGCLAQYLGSIEVNRVITEYFVSVLPTPGGPPSPIGTEPLIQAVSGLIDIFSDEHEPHDVNFRRGHVLDRLEECLPVFRAAVKSIDKRKDGGRELRRRGDEVRENLEDFIAYRKNLGPHYL